MTPPIGGVRAGLYGAGVSAIPDIAEHRWAFSEGSGTTVDDSAGSALMLLSGAGWVSGSWVDGFAGSFDGSNDYGVVDNNQVDIGDSGTLILTVEIDTNNEFDYIFAHPDNSNDNRLFVQMTGSGVKIGLADTFDTTKDLSNNTKYRLAIRWDNGSKSFYVNGTNESSGSYSTVLNPVSKPWYVGSFDGSDFYADCQIDDLIITNKPATESQIQSDYDRQPWS